MHAAARHARAAFIAALAAAPLNAGDRPELSLPVECTLGETCYIQQYVDTDPGPGARDFMCRGLSYDGHKGTDFALPTSAAMQAGVRVLAAAPGRVRGVRDGMADRRYNAAGAGAIKGRECGNGVVIDHGGGWETQYCHMARGSITVHPGDAVARGTPLGRIGLSGRTQFPHLHLSLRHDGAVVDPFAPGGTTACGTPPADTLWHDPPAYRPGGLLAAGFAAAVPEYDRIRAGHAHAARLPANAPALVAWGYAYGSDTADVMRIRIDGPQGPVIDHDTLLRKPQARFFRAAGRKAPEGAWPPGRYSATVTLIRDGAVIDRMQTTTRIE